MKRRGCPLLFGKVALYSEFFKTDYFNMQTRRLSLAVHLHDIRPPWILPPTGYLHVQNSACPIILKAPDVINVPSHVAQTTVKNTAAGPPSLQLGSYLAIPRRLRVIFHAFPAQWSARTDKAGSFMVHLKEMRVTNLSAWSPHRGNVLTWRMMDTRE